MLQGFMNRFLLLFPSLFLLAGCSTGIPLTKYAPVDQPKEDFTFCYGYSCTKKTQTGFTDKEWKILRSNFAKSPAKTAEAERSKIAMSIAKMESIIGAKTGTAHDLPEARSKKEDSSQMDCLDETVNTARYLDLLHKDGLLKFHEPALPIHRGYFVDGAWPHNTAVIKETKTGKLFAVDSFYRANGEVPYIVPAQDWLSGWKPPGAKQ